jgi:hypothetical protein
VLLRVARREGSGDQARASHHPQHADGRSTEGKDAVIHPVSRYGFDPLPGNKGEYVWVEETQSYEPGTYTYNYDLATGYFVRTGYKLKGTK